MGQPLHPNNSVIGKGLLTGTVLNWHLNYESNWVINRPQLEQIQHCQPLKLPTTLSKYSVTSVRYSGTSVKYSGTSVLNNGLTTSIL